MKGSDVMKDTYMKPTIDVIEIGPCEMLALSFYINSEEKGDYAADFARERRGVWGDLWEEEK